MKRSLISRTLTIVRINVLGLAATLLGVAAWALWPSDAKWWGFGVLSVLVALVSLLMATRTIATMWRVCEQDRAVGEFEQIGSEAKSSQMASADRLRRAGMIDV